MISVILYIVLGIFFFAGDLKVYRTLVNVDDCKLLQHDINSLRNGVCLMV
jgi:hypothetical protein